MSQNSCKYHPTKPSRNCRICKTNGNVPESLTQSMSVEFIKPEKKQHGPMTMYGDPHTWNLSSLMRKNVLAAPYFNELFSMKTLNEVLEQIEMNITYVVPYIPGTGHTPSSFFCCLVKLFMMKLTEGQLSFLMEHQNPYIRCAGFLYLRFVGNPPELWDRLQHYTVDNQKFSPSHGEETTIGEFVEKLLTDQSFYSLQLPRIPVPLQREITKRCLLLKQRRERFLLNSQIEFEKNSRIWIHMDDGSVKEGIFKHKEARKAHVLVEEKNLHVNLGDIEQSFTASILAEDLDEKIKEMEAKSAIATGKYDYIKKNATFRLTEPIVQKRGRSPSPEEEIVEKTHQLSAEQIERLERIKSSYLSEESEGVDLATTLAPQKRHHGDEIGPEILKLG